MNMSYKIATLGCKVNQQESEALSARFEALGLVPAGRGGAADVYIINSCTVTSIADSKTRQRIRQARAENPGAFVCVIGCLPEVAKDAVLAMPEVDLAIGTHEKGRAAVLVRDALVQRDGVGGAMQGGSVVDCGAAPRPPAVSLPVASSLAPPPTARRTRAFIKVQDGCDRFCAYCIIPYARGAARSRPEGDVIHEASALLDAGYRELVLTGINLALYGQDIDSDLYGLAMRLCSLGKGHEYRVRLGSLEPTVVDAQSAARIAGIRGVCPHFHLSLQSGAARTLDAMGRPYTPEGYEGIVRALRGADPLFSITTDVIVGFPGETDEDFAESLDFVRRMGFAHVHVFKYSKRPGTRAADMANQAPEDVKRERSTLMIDAAEAGAAHFLKQNKGQVRRTLILGPDKGSGHIRGLTDNGIDIRFAARCDEFAQNEFADITV